ncbi:DUF4886 domain-containing protein [candidate division KSB1 bacterium]
MSSLFRRKYKRFVSAAAALCAGVFIFFSACGDNPADPVHDGLWILFIGNSYTYYNDMPFMLERLAAAVGEEPPLITGEELQAGYALETHWNQGTALQKIRQGNWDYVVLQENSGVPRVNPEIFYDYARLFDEEIKEAGSETVLFLTWATNDDPGYQQLLNSTHETIGNELGALIAPIGIAFEKARAEYPALIILESDGSHPNIKGSYLAACVLYSMLYNKSPEGLPNYYSTGMSEITIASQEEAVILRTIAWETVQEYEGQQ